MQNKEKTMLYNEKFYPDLQYGPGLNYDFNTKTWHLDEFVIEKAMNYCRVLLSPWNSLDYYEHDLTYRSKLHETICFYTDLEPKAVTKLSEEAYKRWTNMADIGKFIDFFLDSLLKEALKPYLERHPDRLTSEQLDKLADDLKQVEMPDLKL